MDFQLEQQSTCTPPPRARTHGGVKIDNRVHYEKAIKNLKIHEKTIPELNVFTIQY